MRDRRWILGALLLAACADEDSGRFFPPESDASTEQDVAAQDAVSDDLGAATDLGRPMDVVTSTDRGPSVDRGPAVDRGANRCPSGCATNGDCDPCREQPGDLYCCVSGLCVFTTGGMCSAQPEPGPINENGDAGGDGAAPDTSANPFDDASGPGDDGGMMMPEDATVPGMDATAPADAPSDVANDLAGDAAG